MEECREFVRDMIGYDLLLREYPQDCLRIDGYVEILTEALCCEEPYLRIGQREYSMYEVKERLYQLSHEHICYVMDCMKNTTSQIGNPRAYTLTALFNAPLTVDQYYDSMIARDRERDNGGSCGGYRYSGYSRDSCGYRYSGSRSGYCGGQRAG